jgi:type IV secretory pathway component VirB8
MAVFPIKPHVPFYVYSRDVWEELPRISRITTYRGEDKNVAVMNFFLKNYLINRESYDLQLYELRYRNIWSESGKNVFARYESFMDASNPYGPYQQYSNKQTRSVNVITIEHDDRPQPSGYERARLIFEATLSSVVTGQEISTSRWQADIVYKYSDFDVDQSLDEHVWIAERLGFTSGKLRPRGEKRKVTPMTFRVYDYNVKELLE